MLRTRSTGACAGVESALGGGVVEEGPPVVGLGVVEAVTSPDWCGIGFRDAMLRERFGDAEREGIYSSGRVED